MVHILSDFPRFQVIQNSFGWRLTKHKGQGVIVLPRVSGEGIVLVREPRVLPDGELGFSLNLPRGGIEPEYSPAENALKELEEETGISAQMSQVRFLGLCSPDNGSFAIHVYCFEVLLDKEQWEARAAVQEEHLTPVLMSDEGFLKSLWSGSITDGLGSHIYLLAGSPNKALGTDEHFLDVQLALDSPIDSDDHEALMRLRERLTHLCNPVGIPFCTDGKTIQLHGFLYADQISRESFFSGVKNLLKEKKASQ